MEHAWLEFDLLKLLGMKIRGEVFREQGIKILGIAVGHHDIVTAFSEKEVSRARNIV